VTIGAEDEDDVDVVGAQLKERGQREQDDNCFRGISKITNTYCVHCSNKAVDFRVPERGLALIPKEPRAIQSKGLTS
jgi:hypothetical protein